jgi:hypothetical protein
MRKAKACYILDEPTGSMGLGTTAVQHGWAFGQSLRLILLATNTNPLPLLLPQHRRADRKLMHGDVRRQGLIQDGLHDVGRERGQVSERFKNFLAPLNIVRVHGILWALGLQPRCR